jgi:hypothetical protein
MLLQLQHNPYFHSFLSLADPPHGYTGKWIVRTHAEKLLSPAAEWNSPEYFEEYVYHGCQFLATMLLWEDAEDALSPETRRDLARRISSWQRLRPGVENEEHPVPRALGLVKRNPHWLTTARLVQQGMNQTQLSCNKRGCMVPFVPEEDTLQQCSKCKVARYVSHLGVHRRRTKAHARVDSAHLLISALM